MHSVKGLVSWLRGNPTKLKNTDDCPLAPELGEAGLKDQGLGFFLGNSLCLCQAAFHFRKINKCNQVFL